MLLRSVIALFIFYWHISMSVNTLIFNHCHNKDFYFAIRLVCLVKGKLARVKRHSQKYSKQSLIFTTQ